MEASSHSPLSAASCSLPCFTSGPWLSRAQQLPHWEAQHSACTLTHTGLALAQADLAWSSGRPQGPWPLYPVTPATDQLGGSWAQGRGNLGLGSRGYSHGTVWGSHAGWEINTKRLESLEALLPLGGMGRIPAGGERQVSAEGRTDQQVASTEPRSGVASYHAGVGLGSAGWLVSSDGRGQHGVGLHKSPPVNQASETQGRHMRTPPHNRAPGRGLDDRVYLQVKERLSLRKAKGRGAAFPLGA